MFLKCKFPLSSLLRSSRSVTLSVILLTLETLGMGGNVGGTGEIGDVVNEIGLFA
jgi:hypothetical protein